MGESSAHMISAFYRDERWGEYCWGEYCWGECDCWGEYLYGRIFVWANIVWANDYSPLRNDRPCGTTHTIGSIVRGFKIGVTKWFRQNTDIYNVWQRNYYEHIIRNDMELQRVREYIVKNPTN